MVNPHNAPAIRGVWATLRKGESMGVLLDAVVGLLDHAMSLRDAPGLPSSPFLAWDTATGQKDPSWPEVGKDVLKDVMDHVAPGSGTLGEAAAEEFDGAMEETREKQDLLDDILKSKDRDPYQDK